MVRTSKSFLGLVLSGVLLVGGPFAGSLRAQDAKRVEAGPPHADGSQVAFEWQYSCTDGKACSFICGSGAPEMSNTEPVENAQATIAATSSTSTNRAGASHVTKLSIRLMTIPIGGKNAAGIFYEYSTVEIPRANGFKITTGISTLACQVNGMNLDYSGQPKKIESPAVKKNESPAVTSSVAQ
jgi:hypothetical protein